MKPIKSSKLGKLSPRPVLDGLPDSLKDIKCFDNIEKQLNKVLISDHEHTRIGQYIKCKRCQPKFQKRKEMIKNFGFLSINQYLEWRRIMNIIKNGKDFKVQ